jgi:hypothetical protein
VAVSAGGTAPILVDLGHLGEKITGIQVSRVGTEGVRYEAVFDPNFEGLAPLAYNTVDELVEAFRLPPGSIIDAMASMLLAAGAS